MINITKQCKVLALLFSILFLSCEKEEGSSSVGNEEDISNCFNITSGTLYAEMQINFDASCSQTFEYYEWDFGDGTTGLGLNSSHTYDNEGSYKVVLYVGNDYDDLKKIEKTIDILPSPFINHCDNIEDDEIWAEGLHLVDCSIEINGSLTIEPGAKIYIGEEKYLKVNGELLAVGSQEKPIIFTPANNTTDPGSWGYIQFSPTASSNSILNYCEIKFGGKTDSFSYPDWDYYSQYGVVHLEESQISIKNTKIEGAANYGISLSENSKFIEFENNTFTNNVNNPIKIPALAVETLGSSSIFEDGLSILVEGEEYFNPETDVTWYAQDVPYYIDYTLGLNSDVDFVIEPGTVIELATNNFLNAGYFITRKGRIIAVGTESEPITFTSAHEVKNKGDWAGILISDDSVLENCIIEYAGADYTTGRYNRAIQIKGNAATLNNCIINECSGVGIDMDAESAFIANNTIKNCDDYGVTIHMPQYRIIRESNIFENTGGFHLEDKANLIEDVTLEKRDYPYVVEGLYFNLNSTLTIEPGVEIQIRSGQSLRAGFDYNSSVVSYSGNIIANGTENNPIIFTLYFKDREEGNGNWGGFIFGEESTESSLQYCLISDGGYHPNTSTGTIREGIGMIHCNQTSNFPVIKNNTISNSSSYGITLNNSEIDATNNTFMNNKDGDTYSY